jgi:hypothetical protein
MAKGFDDMIEPRPTRFEDGHVEAEPHIVLERHPDGGELVVPVRVFEALFGPGPHTYASLSAHPLSASTSWGRHFAMLRDAGIID